MSEAGRHETITLRLHGMTCADCQKHVLAALRSVPGVSDAVVDLSVRRATVTWDLSRASVDDLAAAVERVGYRAELAGARA